MESIIYRFSLDMTKSGIQKTLQGFGTGDAIARKLAITFVAGSNTYAIDADHTEALMYVEDPGTGVVSINKCDIKDNVVYYKVVKSDVRSAGFELMQCKLITTNPNTGVRKVVAAPKFQLEIDETENLDDIIEAELEEGTFEGTFSALEKAVARAQAYYHGRLVQIEFDEEFAFHAYYADGVEYVNDEMKELYADVVDAVEKSKSNMEETLKNAAQAAYSQAVASSAAAEASDYADICKDAVREVQKSAISAAFKLNFETGELEYDSNTYTFTINSTTGNLEYYLVEEE